MTYTITIELEEIPEGAIGHPGTRADWRITRMPGSWISGFVAQDRRAQAVIAALISVGEVLDTLEGLTAEDLPPELRPAGPAEDDHGCPPLGLRECPWGGPDCDPCVHAPEDD
jgi:hypothetical protein